MALRHGVIGAGLWAARASGVHRWLAPWMRGAGAILTFHRVEPSSRADFAPNAGLSIEPRFLDALLSHVVDRGYRVVPLDAVPDLLRTPDPHRPFLVLTFDDGYRDTVAEALPVLERHGAPFTVFATTGFLDRSARLWWVELERALVRLSRVRFAGAEMATGTVREKAVAFTHIRRLLLAGSQATSLEELEVLVREAGLVPADIVDELCLDWDGLARLSRHPLASIGCHTVTHPRLAGLPSDRMRAEMTDARARLERELSLPVRHLCYPYGVASAAADREFQAAAELGFATAVTTRPGVLGRSQAHRLTALPRISVNGLWQDLGSLDVLLSGIGLSAGARWQALVGSAG